MSARTGDNPALDVALHLNIAANAHRSTDELVFCLAVLRQLRLPSGLCVTLSPADALLVELPSLGCADLQRAHPFLAQGNPLPRVMTDPLTNPLDISSDSEFAFQAQYVLKFLRGLAEGRLSSRLPPGQGGRDMDPHQENVVTVDEAARLLGSHEIDLCQGTIRASCFVRYMYEQLQQVEASVFLKMEFAPWFPGEHAGVRGIRDIVVENLIESAKDFAFASSQPAEDPALGIRGQVGFPVIARWNEVRRPLLVFNQASAHATGGHGDFTLLCRDSMQLQGADIAHWKMQPSIFVDFGVAERHQDSRKNKEDKIDLLLRIFGGAGMASGSQQEMLVDRLMQTEFALTYDNVLKMVAIYIRQKAGIPCLLEGENGCGKTRLIQYLADILNITLIQADVHGGFTEADVLAKVSEARAQAIMNEAQTIWLFFDEINTAPDVMGMFKEILCDMQCLGEDLPANLKVMAACNPHRYLDPNAPERGNRCAGALDRKHLVDRDGGSRRQLYEDPLDDRNLVYRVVPIPRSLSQYRWTFGCLSDHDEKLYVSEMVMQSVSDRAARKFLVECILRSHQYLRGWDCYGDISAVSLRDAARCVKVYSWWIDRDASNCEPRSAAILAVALTYYFRLKNTDENESMSTRAPRQELARAVNETSKRCFGNTPSRAGFEDILLNFQHRVVSMLAIPEGIAKNAVLLENIFVVFACVQNRIPVIVVGEPGCSKTLSVQLIFKHSSALERAGFAKMLPVPFQCSRLSTANAIAERFQFAVDFQMKQASSDVLSVLCLDEVGLAEQSEHRPLKVLHRLLEHPEVSFIGLSNWQLDAAKMNRMVLHTCPKLSRSGLVRTAVTIITEGRQNITESRWSSQMVGVNVVKDTVEDIVDAYFCIVHDQPCQHFFGRRDLYSTLQQLARDDQLSCADIRVRNDAVVRVFERNFGGGDDGHQFVYNILARYFDCERIRKAVAARGSMLQGLSCGPSSLTLIRDSLVDFGRPGEDGKPSSLNPRNVMCLTTDEIMWRTLLKDGVLNANLSQVEVLIGSEFPGDTNSALSVYERVNIFRRCMQNGETVVLVNCDDLYGSLYACLNLQYQTYAGRKWCSIALGAESMKVRVHENFKVVVVASAAEAHGGIIPRPFLNRFEKQFISRRNTLAGINMDHSFTLVKDVTARLERMIGIRGSNNQQWMREAFPGATKETIASAIVSAGKLASEDSVLEMLIWSMTPETAAISTDEVFHAYFHQQVHAHLPALLSTLFSDISSLNLIVRTYSFEVPPSILERELTRDAPLPGCIKVVPLRHHRSSADFVSMLEKDVRDGSADDLLVISMPETEVSLKHISHIMHLIDEMRRVHKSECRVVSLVHLDRHRRSQPSILPLLFETGWSSVFIDSVIQPGVQHAASWSDILRSPLLKEIPRRVSVEEPCLKDIVRRALSVLAYPATVDVIDKLNRLQNLASMSAEFCEAIQSVVRSLCCKAQYTAADIVLERQTLSPFLASVLNSHTSAATATRTGSFFERLNAVVDDGLCACVVQILRVLDANDNLALANCRGPVGDLWFSWLQVLTSTAVADMSVESEEPLRAGHRVTVVTEFSSMFPFSIVLFGHAQALLEDAREFDEQQGGEMLSAGLSSLVPEDMSGTQPETGHSAADSIPSMLGTKLTEDFAKRYVHDALSICGIIKSSFCTSGITPDSVASRLVEYVLDTLRLVAESIDRRDDWVNVPLVNVHRAVVDLEATLVGLNALLCALHSAGALGAERCTPGNIDSWLSVSFDLASDVVVDDARAFVSLVDTLESCGTSSLLDLLHVSQKTQQRWSALKIRRLCASVVVAMEEAGAGADALGGIIQVLPLCDSAVPSLGRIVDFIGPITNDTDFMGIEKATVLRACSAVICRFALDCVFGDNTEPSVADLSLIVALIGESGSGDNDLEFDVSVVRDHIQPVDRQRVIDALSALILTEDCRKRYLFAQVENTIEPFLGNVQGESPLAGSLIRSLESRLSIQNLQQSSTLLVDLVADQSVLVDGRGLSHLLAVAAARRLIGGHNLSYKFVEWPLAVRSIFSDSPPQLIPGIHLFWARRVFRDLGPQHFSERAREGWWPFMADSDVKSCQMLATVEMDGADPFVVLGESYALLSAKVLSRADPDTSASSSSPSAQEAAGTLPVCGMYIPGCVAISMSDKRGVTKRSLDMKLGLTTRAAELPAPYDDLCRLAAEGALLGPQDSPVISLVLRHWTIALGSTDVLHATLVGMLVRNPDIFNNGYVPGMPNDHLAHVRGGADVMNASEFTCPNGHSFFVGECRHQNQVGICPECQAQIGGIGVDGVHQTNGGERAVQGLVLEVGQIPHDGAGERQMTRTEELIVRLVVCLTLAGGLQCSGTVRRQISTLVGQQPTQKIQMQIRRLFDAVCRALQRAEQSVGVLLHLIIHRCTTAASPPRSGDASEASRRAFEQWFVERCCQPVLRNPGESIATLSQSSISRAVARELDTAGGCAENDLDTDDDCTNLLQPHLWKLNPPPMSLASFEGSLADHRENDRVSFGPLMFLLQVVETMELIQDFTALVEWHMWVWRHFSRKHTRQYMKDITVHDVLIEFPEAQSLWVRFEAVWNRITNSSMELHLECQKVPIPEISVHCSLLLTVAADKATAKYLLVLLENIVSMHNGFLSRLQQEAANVQSAKGHIRLVQDISSEPLAIDVCDASQVVQLNVTGLLAIIRQGMYFGATGSCAFDFDSIQKDVLTTFIKNRRHIYTRLPKLRFMGEVNFSVALSKRSGADGKQQEDLSMKAKHAIVSKLETVEAVEEARVVLEECVLFPVMSSIKSLYEFTTETLRIEASRAEFLLMPDGKEPPVMPHHLAALSRLLDQRLSGLDPAKVPDTLPAYASKHLTSCQGSLLTTMLRRLDSAQKTMMTKGLWQFLRDYGKEEMLASAPLKVYLENFEVDTPWSSNSQQQATTFGEFEWFAQHFPDQESDITLALAVDVYRFMVGGGDGTGQQN
uniref:RZ-type domain-containing protein n=1 Tax=Odontella aurita TaxID=265563 RepID=A0A7S4IA45_9STRA